MAKFTSSTEITKIKHRTCDEYKKPRVKLKAKKKKVKPKNRFPFLECDSMLRRMNYAEFLESKYWKYVRKVVLARDNYKCMICKKNSELNIHHDTYKHHFKELDHLEDLMTLCRTCHKEHHYAK